MKLENSQILVAYFSHSGNTLVVAEEISKMVGADLFEIKLKNPTLKITIRWLTSQKESRSPMTGRN
jgi:flavodoxin